MMRYLVVIEETDKGFGAYVPDLPGCIAAAETREEVTRLIHEAIAFHLDGLRQDGLPIPEAHSYPELVEISGG
jgi:predicted RNase H-like HicB family nuclease